MNVPEALYSIQHAVQHSNKESFKKFVNITNKMTNKITIRGLLNVKSKRKPIPLEKVESAKKIIKRFVTGAMSYGSISKETQSAISIAMNRLGSKSNTGEGGEDEERVFMTHENGDSERNAIKQVASGRFGINKIF